MARRNNNSNGQSSSNEEKERQQRNVYIPEYDRPFNKRLAACESGTQVIEIIAQEKSALTSTAGGGKLSPTNYATAMHRVARTKSLTDRNQLLSDPLFALFLCSMAERLAGLPSSVSLVEISQKEKIYTHCDKDRILQFSTRDWADILMGLAKYDFVASQKLVPLSRDLNEAITNMIQTSLQIRRQVALSFNPSNNNNNNEKKWMSSISLLAAFTADIISFVCHENMQTRLYALSLTNLLWAYAKMDRANQPIYQVVSDGLASVLSHETNPKYFGIILWSYAKSEISGQHLTTLIQKIADILDESPSVCAALRVETCSIIAWALANIVLNRTKQPSTTKYNDDDYKEEDALVVRLLQIVARDITKRCDEYGEKDVSNVIWAMGSIGFGALRSANITKDSYTDNVIVQTNDWQRDRALVKEVASAIEASCAHRLDEFLGQGLCNVAFGFARLQLSEYRTLFTAMGKELGNPNRRVTDRDISSFLKAFAKLGFVDRPLYETVISKMATVKTWEHRTLNDIAWSFGKAEFQISDSVSKFFDTSFFPTVTNERYAKKILKDPMAVCIQILGQEMLSQIKSFPPRSIVTVLRGFSQSMIRHPKVFRTIAEEIVGKATTRVEPGKLHCGSGFESYSSREIADFLLSYAKQAYIASEYEISGYEGPGKLKILWSIHLDMGGDFLLKRLVNAALSHLLRDASNLDPIDMINALWSIATLGYHHGPFVSIVEKETIKRMKSYINGDRSEQNFFMRNELSSVVWGLATFNKSSPDLLDLVAPYIQAVLKADNIDLHDLNSNDVETIAKQYQRHDFANFAWSCAVANHFPPDLMRLVYSCTVGKNIDDAADLAKTFGDEGLSEVSSSSLLYVQSLMDAQGLDLGLALPPGFPNGWMAKGETCDRGSNSTVYISKVQQSVLDMCNAMGLDGKSEYKIPLNDALSLSSDIAFPKHRLCIEVEGPSHFYFDLDEWDPSAPPPPPTGTADLGFNFSGKRGKLNGSTALRNIMLNILGWRVLSIPSFDWKKMGNQEREEYIEDLLKSQNVPIASK